MWKEDSSSRWLITSNLFSFILNCNKVGSEERVSSAIYRNLRVNIRILTECALIFFLNFTCHHLINHSYFTDLFWRRYKTQRDVICFFSLIATTEFFLRYVKILIKCFCFRIPIIWQFLNYKIGITSSIIWDNEVISQCSLWLKLKQICLSFTFVWLKCYSLTIQLKSYKNGRTGRWKWFCQE